MIPEEFREEFEKSKYYEWAKEARNEKWPDTHKIMTREEARRFNELVFQKEFFISGKIDYRKRFRANDMIYKIDEAQYEIYKKASNRDDRENIIKGIVILLLILFIFMVMFDVAMGLIIFAISVGPFLAKALVMGAKV